MPDASPDYRWRFAASPVADPDDDRWIHVEGGGLRQPLYLQISQTEPAQPYAPPELVVTGLLINNGQAVTSTDLRLPLRRILEQFESHLWAEAKDTATPRSSDEWHYLESGQAQFDSFLGLMSSLPESKPAPRGRGAPPPSEDELKAFAAVYVQELGEKPRGAVSRAAERFGMHRVTAHKWIQRCREAGILPIEESDR